MALPVLNIYTLIGAPSEKNGFTAVGLSEFGYMLQAAVNSGEGKAQVRINSGGGSWEMAQGIFGLIKASALKIDTYCDGLAASSASLVFMAGAKRYISAHARLMIHNCSSPAHGQIADLEKAITMQQAINDSMATVYANATGLPMERIREMMAAETWLSADEALALGFATHIINNDKKALAPAAELTASTATANLQHLQAYYAAHLPQTSTMKHLLLPILTAQAVAGVTAAAGITTTSTDEQVTAAVQAAFTDLAELRRKEATQALQLTTAANALSALQTDHETTTAKLKELEQKQAQADQLTAEQQATAVVTAAVKEGRILASQEAHFVTLAKADLTATSGVLAMLPARKSLTEQVAAVTTVTAQDGSPVGPLTAAGAMAEIKANLARK